MAAFAMMAPASHASERNGISEYVSSVSIPTAPTMEVTHSGIELTSYRNVTRFSIYSITGQIIKSVEVSDGTVTVELPKGYYIVKCDEWVKRVVIR